MMIVLALHITEVATASILCRNVVLKNFEVYRSQSITMNTLAPTPALSRSEWEWQASSGIAKIRFGTGTAIQIGNFNLNIIGVLGESSSIAYLAQNSTGRRFVIKVQLSTNMFIFELRITEYLRENGFDVPKIISHENQNLILKEYFPGLTYIEVLDAFKSRNYEKYGWTERDLPLLKNELHDLHKNYSDLMKGGFAKWLLVRYPTDYALVSESNPNLIAEGDLKLNNYIYSLSERRWRKYDP